MKRAVTLQAPAKVNLHLDIGAVRDDGFHDLTSLFQIVSLADTITIRSLKNTDTCRISGDFSCAPEKNLIYRAYRLFCERTGTDSGIEVEVSKRIPEGAGLGGGSSNAAATLKGLNLLFDGNLSEAELAGLGERLGSDVPFFCRAPLALVAGRGEVVAPLEKPRSLPLVLIVPDFSVSTADAYRWLDEERRKANEHVSGEQLKREYELSPGAWSFFNSFTPVLKQRYPEIGDYLASFRESGAVYAEVSGSGSSMFGVFESPDSAENAAKNLIATKKLKQVLTIETLARFPSSILQ